MLSSKEIRSYENRRSPKNGWMQIFTKSKSCLLAYFWWLIYQEVESKLNNKYNENGKTSFFLPNRIGNNLSCFACMCCFSCNHWNTFFQVIFCTVFSCEYFSTITLGIKDIWKRYMVKQYFSELNIRVSI